jgi:hypothetical protein
MGYRRTCSFEHSARKRRLWQDGDPAVDGAVSRERYQRVAADELIEKLRKEFDRFRKAA